MRNEIFQGKFVGEERIYDMFTERVKDTLCLTGCHRRQTVYLGPPHFNLDTEMGTLVLPEAKMRLEDLASGDVLTLQQNHGKERKIEFIGYEIKRQIW